MNKDHFKKVFKEKIISFSPLINIVVKSCHAQMCLWFGTGSQVSDVAHGPLVFFVFLLFCQAICKYIKDRTQASASLHSHVYWYMIGHNAQIKFCIEKTTVRSIQI